jgi:hypothetical protein
MPNESIAKPNKLLIWPFDDKNFIDTYELHCSS